mmetsp:Transcript_7231/g.10759  ORF Transcript_7231/g.10759 Transcript_7231/m.10759 type:complete len:464 (+) Transcript_7231:64-1455(+)
MNSLDDISSTPKSCRDINVDDLDFSATTPSEVVLIVEECKSSLSIAEWACKSISSFTSLAVKKRNAEAMAQLLDEGICECLVNTMNMHCASSSVVASCGCGALSDLAWTSRELREFLGEVGACECVVFALTMNVGDAEVAEYGTSTIINLCKDNISNSFRLAEAGACDVVVQTGNFGFNFNHPKCETIAANVCTSIYHLCEAANQPKLHDSGACELVAALLKFHVDKVEVALAATKAICGLSSLTADNREGLGRASSCALIIQAMTQHEKCLPIVENCCESIMHLALSPANTERLASAGACEAVVKALDKYLIDREFGSEICCGAMVNLISNGASAPGNIIRLRMAGAAELMQRVHSSTRASHRARENATHIVQNITASISIGVNKAPAGVLDTGRSSGATLQASDIREYSRQIGGTGSPSKTSVSADTATSSIRINQSDDDDDNLLLARTSSSGIDRDVYEI